jgi:hypothetical protein
MISILSHDSRVRENSEVVMKFTQPSVGILQFQLAALAALAQLQLGFIGVLFAPGLVMENGHVFLGTIV